MHTTLVETDNYLIKTCQQTNANILERKVDNHYCYIDDSICNIISEIDSIEQFDKVATTFTFMNPFMERNS